MAEKKRAAKAKAKPAAGEPKADAEKPLELPKALEPFRDSLRDALNTYCPLTWPEGEDAPTYLSADQVAAIARVVIQATHPELVGAQIGYVLRDRIKDKWAVMRKAPPILTFFADYDYVMEVNLEQYRFLRPAQRVALVDHELTHCMRDAEKEAWVIVPHDLEEFNSIAQRWGVWRPNLRDFRRALEKGAKQMDLFADPSPAKEDRTEAEAARASGAG